MPLLTSLISSLLIFPASLLTEETLSCSREEEDLTNLWRINTEPPSYFFGTIHVPYTLVWDGIAENAKRAFVTSDNVYFELDLSKVTEEEDSCQLLPQNKTLADVVTPELHQRLSDHLDRVREEIPSWLSPEQRALGLNGSFLYSTFTDDWQRKKPLWVRKESILESIIFVVVSSIFISKVRRSVIVSCSIDSLAPA